MKLWDKDSQVNEQIEDFTVGNDFILDQKLVKYDCRASIAHAKMLGRVGLLSDGEVEKLVEALDDIIMLDEKAEFLVRKEQEDCHTAIENHLTQRLGDLGKKIHTARSRNDQVLTALRLYYKDELQRCDELINVLYDAIADFDQKYGGVRWPGYTHLRKAMPSTMRLWATAFVDAMTDNQKLLSVAQQLVDQSPLGTAAGYGVPFEIDRKFTAGRLGFARVQGNPIYAQISRGKFEATILHALSQIMFDLNKMATDLTIFSMPEFSYFELPAEFCTGSSIMPQKKNPDVLELLRAKYHLVIGCELQIKNLSANLPSGYNRDVQLTKEPTMNGLETTQQCLAIACLIFENLEVHADRCEKALTEEVFATEEVYALVRKGVPFREAYREIARKFS
ncbi:argininosuccinate lyase [bacterium]|nr:argininosuccinate lyase [bacterium]